VAAGVARRGGGMGGQTESHSAPLPRSVLRLHACLAPALKHNMRVPFMPETKDNV